MDKTSFLVALATLAAAGAGGYVVRDRNILRPPEPSAPAPTPSATSEPAHTIDAAAAAASTAPPQPACDDTTGTVGPCPPPVYPAEEGTGCGGFPPKRCEDFKQAMKPRVAERAVACLNALNPAQRCDPNRVNLCAHVALMNACPAVESAPVGLAAAADEVALSCEAIVRGCGGGLMSPSMRDCRATLAGLTILGRDRLASCMKTHCADRGLLGCEVAPDIK